MYFSPKIKDSRAFIPDSGVTRAVGGTASDVLTSKGTLVVNNSLTLEADMRTNGTLGVWGDEAVLLERQLTVHGHTTMRSSLTVHGMRLGSACTETAPAPGGPSTALLCLDGLTALLSTILNPGNMAWCRRMVWRFYPRNAVLRTGEFWQQFGSQRG